MLTLEPVAHIHSDFPTKFGIPRQSGLVEELEALVVFEPPWRDDNALRGIEGFSHLWLIWEFSQSPRGSWSPTVRPPRLGGNRRVGVFASRSPFRPNPLGLSCVRLLGLEKLPGQGTALRVGGADLLDGSPCRTAIPMPGAGLPRLWRRTTWRCAFRRSWPRGCRQPSSPRSRRCWPRIPAPPTRRTRNGFTVSDLRGWRSGSGCRERSSPWWKSPPGAHSSSPENGPQS